MRVVLEHVEDVRLVEREKPLTFHFFRVINPPNDIIFIVLDEFELNLRNRTLTKSGINIELTQVEFQIIEYFFKNPNAALSRTDILKQVWGENYFGDEKIVDVNIRRLRMKIEDNPSSPTRLTTIWGLGYKWITNQQ